MLNKSINLSKIGFSLMISFASAGIVECLSSCTTCFGDKVDISPNPQNIQAYYEKDSQRMSSESKWAAYFDFSGVYIAYEDPTTAQTFNGITQKVTGSLNNYDLYSLANEKIEKLNGEDLHSAANIFAQLHNPSAQGQLYAPIEKTLEKIVKENRSALLVTDFEEYTPGHQIYQQAYSTPYFEEWLKRGKDITFFVTDYKEGSLDKHLYYTVFDDENHRLLKEIEDGLQGKAQNYRRFSLSMHNYSVMPKKGGTSGAYAGPCIGGTYHDENGDDVVTGSIENGKDDGFNYLQGSRAELYTFDENWQAIVENARGQQEEEIPLQYRFRHLFQNLYADFSNVDSYQIKGLAARMTDIGKDFDLYMNWHTAMLYKPKTTIVEGEKEIEVPTESSNLYDEQGNLLPEFDYVKLGGRNIADIQGVVAFDQSLFAQSFAKTQGHDVELAVDLNPQFGGVIAGNEESSGLYRIDIIVAKAEPNLGIQIDNLFSWPGNNCLSSAIRNVLQHCNPQGSCVYSYFIRMNQ